MSELGKMVHTNDKKEFEDFYGIIMEKTNP